MGKVYICVYFSCVLKVTYQCLLPCIFYSVDCIIIHQCPHVAVWCHIPCPCMFNAQSWRHGYQRRATSWCSMYQLTHICHIVYKHFYKALSLSFSDLNLCVISLPFFMFLYLLNLLLLPLEHFYLFKLPYSISFYNISIILIMLTSINLWVQAKLRC